MPLLFLGQDGGAKSEVQQPGHEEAPTQDVGTSGNFFSAAQHLLFLSLQEILKERVFFKINYKHSYGIKSVTFQGF